MRSSKSILAGLAAGALGAALIPFVAAAPASAGTATTVVFGSPSVTVVGSDYFSGTAIPTPVYLLDAAGDLVSTADDTAGLAVEVSIVKPVTALVDDTLAVNFTSASGTAIKKASTTYTSANLAAISVAPNGPAGTSWDSIADFSNVGTYTLTARLYVAGSGATVSTSTMSFTVSNNAAAPTPNVAFANAAATSSANVINALGATTGDSVGDGNGDLFVYLTDANGGPYYIIDDSVSIAATNTSGTLAWTQTGGLSGSPSPIYKFDNTGANAWGSSASSTITATVTPGATPSYGTLAAGIAAANALTTAPTVSLSSTPSYQPDPTVDTYQVAPGTNSLSFAVESSDGLTSSTMAYNAVSSASIDLGDGRSTPSGGAAVISADAGTVTVALNAAAAASGENLQLTVGDYKSNKTTTVTVNFVAGAATVTAAAPITKVATETVVAGTILTQYGAVLPGTWAITVKNGAGASCSATTIAAGTANAAGAFEVTIPASFAPTAAGTKSFTICASNGFTSAQVNETVTYTATGGLNALTVAVTTPSLTSSYLPVIKTPASAVVDLTTDTTNYVAATSVATADVNAAGTGTAFQLTVTSNPAATISVAGPAGVHFTTSTTGSLSAAAGSNPLVTATTGSPNATKVISVYATKPGTHEITVSGGSSSAKISFVAGVAIGSGRTLTAEPAAIELKPNDFKATSVKLVDLYGNPVPDDTGITVALAGGGTLSSTSTITNANGVATVYYTAPLGDGNGQLLWSMASGKYISASISGYPAAVNTATTAIKVTNTPGGDKSILIVGERATVSGKPGIRVEGETTGFDTGSKMVPSVRFPGQTEYTEGTARPTTSALGDFSWQRKTGKKTYVFFSNEAGDVKSNRVIIPAN